MYPAELVAPMSKDLTDHGFESLVSGEQVDNVMNDKEGSFLLVVNSVCGCAAANARPGAKMSIKNDKSPSTIVTVFAGVDKEATNQARGHMVPFPPSSPCMALFKNGELVHMLERHHIEGRPAELIAENLIDAYNEHC